MSSRVLRKLQGEKDFLSELQDGNSDPESDLEGSGGARKKQLNVNRYDLDYKFYKFCFEIYISVHFLLQMSHINDCHPLASVPAHSSWDQQRHFKHRIHVLRYYLRDMVDYKK
ncbi:hypothetical protein L9F63_019473 [Diploptera punctata]|uniref:Uncharacterized protein n=1 Tax=Diploptera punctata TaxID=6984 RepID=A0AAD7ZU73_DIPPU|nr:hypothetical protein L9F63_019473 [Diploptera punctata]